MQRPSQTQTLSSLLLCPIVLSTPSYLIGHPLTPICNSNENQTPALPTFTPLCKIPATTTRRNRPRRKEAMKKAPIRSRILCYCWPGRSDCQNWSGKMVPFIESSHDRGLLTRQKNDDIMLTVGLSGELINPVRGLTGQIPFYTVLTQVIVEPSITMICIGIAVVRPSIQSVI